MAIVIDVKLADNKTDSALNRLEKAIAKLDDVVTRMNSGLNMAASQTNQIAANMGRAASSAQRIKSTMLAVVPPPVQSWEQVMEGHRAGAAAGDPESVRKFLQADRELKRKARARKLATGEGDSLMEIFARTRFASVGGIPIPMPLGRDLKQLGGMAGIDIGKVLGPKFAGTGGAAMAAAGIAAAGAAAYMLSKGLQEAYTRVREYTGAYHSIGGSSGQAGGAMTVSRALGLSPDYAAALGARIGSDSVARMIAARAGVNGTRGYFGDINDAEAMRSVIRYLGTLSYGQARREAIGLGDAKLAEAALYTPGLRNRLLGAPGLSMGEMQSGAELSGELALLNQNLSKLIAPMSESSGRTAVEGVSLASDFVNSMTELNKVIPPALNNLFKLKDLFEKVNGFEISMSPLRNVINIIDKLRGVDKTREKELKTLEGIKKGIDSLNDGVYGGGPNARRAQSGPRGGMDGKELDRSVIARDLRSGLGI